MSNNRESDVSLAGRTLIQLSHVIVRLEDRVLSRELGLSYRQMRILKHVNAGVESGTELVKIFGVTAPAVSETLESLVRKGLLVRRPHETDRRAVKLELTDAGRELSERSEVLERELSVDLLAPLDAAEVKTLLGLADRMLAPGQARLIEQRLSNS